MSSRQKRGRSSPLPIRYTNGLALITIVVVGAPYVLEVPGLSWVYVAELALKPFWMP
jgi:hypothetical protein